MKHHDLSVLAFGGRIRPPEDDETPLSPDECWVAIRECMKPIETEEECHETSCED